LDLQLPPIRFSLPVLLISVVISIVSYFGLLVGYYLSSAFGILLFLLSLLFFALGFFLILTFPPIFWFQVLQRGKSLVVHKRDMLKAFAWGLVSPIPVLVITFGLEIAYTAITGNAVNDNFDTAVTAPILEELCKAMGLVLLMKRIRNPYDGMLIGFCAGAGFSVCENLLYFSSVAGSGFGAGIATGFSDWAFVASVRSVMAVESHALGTSLVGLGLGYYLEGKRRGSGFLPAVLFGYLGAVALHAAWNGSIIALEAVMPNVLGEGLLSDAFTICFIVCFFLGELFILLTARKRCQAREDSTLQRAGPKGSIRPKARPF
jgi:protease PrsW